MNNLSGQVLIVEDEANIRAGLKETLAKDEHLVIGVSSGEEALIRLAAGTYHVAVVDIRMPGMSGIQLLQAIRRRWPFVAVIILTGHGELESAIAGLQAGAHDYLLKPAQPDTVRKTVNEALGRARQRTEQARLLDALRSGLDRLDGVQNGGAPRLKQPPVAGLVEFGDLGIDLGARQVVRGGRPVHLSPSEFNVLAVLATRQGDVVDYETLTQLSLGYEVEPWEARELIKRHVFAIRQKIEPKPGSPRYLLNIRGVGYRLAGQVST
jgi:DNA-binding response OmpR family regulator